MRTDPADLDDRIRTLVGRAVAESPQAPDAVHVTRRGAELVADPTHHRGRPSRALVVGIAAAVLAVVATVVVVARHDDRDRTVVSHRPGEQVRFVLGDDAEGYRLVSWRDQIGGDQAAVDAYDTRPVPPAVAVFRRDDGIRVRVSRPYSGDGEVDHGSDQEPDDEAWLRRRIGDPEVDEDTVEIAGATAVRAGHLGVAEEARATSFALRQGEDLVGVDVYGLGDDGALAALDGFTARPGGGLEPPEGGPFEVVVDLPAASRSSSGLASTRITYEGPEGRQVVVSTLAARPESDDLLANLRNLGLGTLERWGDREVLVHLPRGAEIATVAFAEAGRIVHVQGELDDLPDLVDGLVAAGDAGWGEIVADATAQIRALGTADVVDVGAARIEVHRAVGSDRPAGWCLTVDGSTACAAEEPPLGEQFELDASGARAFDVLVDGHWWVFGRGDTRGPNEEEGASGPLEFPGRVDVPTATYQTQVEVDDVWWWTWQLPDAATALSIDVLRPPDGSGIGHGSSRPAS